jgi:putative spermidine/putrescine transport system ATP-binding protein
MSDRVAVFDDGIIQQLATPADLYERPENAFVAQFIGENNRLKALVTDVKKDIVTAKTSGGTELSARKVNCGDVGSYTTLSIRPERVSVGVKGQNTTKAKVLELIYLGDHIRCRMSVERENEFIVKVPNSSNHTHLEVGEETIVSWTSNDCRALDIGTF